MGGIPEEPARPYLQEFARESSRSRGASAINGGLQIDSPNLLNPMPVNKMNFTNIRDVAIAGVAEWQTRWTQKLLTKKLS
jgi:hypothetical protein